MAKKNKAAMRWYNFVEWLVIIGAVVWGLIGLFNFNLVEWIFGAGSVVSNIVYTLVGLSGVALIGFKMKGW